MIRQRKGEIGHHNPIDNVNYSDLDDVKRKENFPLWIVVGVCVILFLIIFALIFSIAGTTKPIVYPNTIVQINGLSRDLYWGSYRPRTYFGLKTRDPWSPVFGLMWFELSVSSAYRIRHWCLDDDRLKYGWTYHDGVTFGEKLIVDYPYELTISFVKTPGSHGQWTARVNITADPRQPTLLFGLVWYAALDSNLGQTASTLWTEGKTIKGYTPQMKNFTINLVPHTGRPFASNALKGYLPGLRHLKDKMYTLIQKKIRETLAPFGGNAMLKGPLGPDDELLNDDEGKPTSLVAFETLIEPAFPTSADIVFTTEESKITPLVGEEYNRVLQMKKREFHIKFDEKFKLRDKGYSFEDIEIAQKAMSNILGDIGFVATPGHERDDDIKGARDPPKYWKAPVYATVPSRSEYRSGLLFGDGFHGFLIGSWSPSMQMDIAAHWLDLINVEGWISKEILGSENRTTVKKNEAAYPPMLMIQLAETTKRWPKLFNKDGQYRNTLEKMFPVLHDWFQWFLHFHEGDLPTSYRWPPREDDVRTLNPETPTSVLADYPRASNPSDMERHVDLRCWVYAASDAMTTIAQVLQKNSTMFEDIRNKGGDEDLLNELHWSTQSGTYADFGNHTDDVVLVPKEATLPEYSWMKVDKVRALTTKPEPRLVTSAFGYVSLFPLLLKVLRPSSDKLGMILDQLDKPDLLWSPYGLRSLSKSSPLYMKSNTDDEELPSWRGQVWLNINYLALSALKHYGQEGGPHAARARELNAKLRDNVVQNVLKEYRRTGFLWEHYSGEDGTGSGLKPYSGTALVVLLMAEEY